MKFNPNIQSEAPSKLALIRTNNYITIQAICEDTHQNLKLNAIIGFPGAGKTTALENYLKGRNDAFLVSVTKSMSASNFFHEMLAKLGYPNQDRGMRLHFLIKKICYILNSTSKKKLLIIDEAGRFTTIQMQYIHELRDQTRLTTGIILSGPESFERDMRTWDSKDIPGIPEIFSRINHWEFLLRPTKWEIKAVCEANGVMDMATITTLQKKCNDFRKLENQIMKRIYNALSTKDA